MSDSSAGPLAGRVVLVTGASSGIGRAIAVGAARAGADVALTYKSNVAGARATEAQIRGLGRRAATFPIDITEEHAIATLGRAVRDDLGRIDAWVNNAGADILTGRRPPCRISTKLDLLLAVDLRGTMLASWQAAEILCRAARRRRHHQHELGPRVHRHGRHRIPALRRREGRRAGVQQVAGAIACAARARQRDRARLDRDLVRRRARIEIARAAVVESTPLERWGTPEDVAGAAVFLASPAAAFITGQTIAGRGWSSDVT